MYHVHPKDEKIVASTSDPTLAAVCALHLGEGSTIQADKWVNDSTGNGYRHKASIVLFVCPLIGSSDRYPDPSTLGHTIAALATHNNCCLSSTTP